MLPICKVPRDDDSQLHADAAKAAPPPAQHQRHVPVNVDGDGKGVSLSAPGRSCGAGMGHGGGGKSSCLLSSNSSKSSCMCDGPFSSHPTPGTANKLLRGLYTSTYSGATLLLAPHRQPAYGNGSAGFLASKLAALLSACPQRAVHACTIITAASASWRAATRHAPPAGAQHLSAPCGSPQTAASRRRCSSGPPLPHAPAAPT